jgi:acetyl esterase/lipase
MLVEGVAAHGWSVAIPGYSLAPDASLTQIVGEISQSLDWLAANGESYGVSGPAFLSGWSAGGHLTAMALDHPRVTAGLAISGVYDTRPRSWRVSTGHCAMR